MVTGVMFAYGTSLAAVICMFVRPRTARIRDDRGVEGASMLGGTIDIP